MVQNTTLADYRPDPGSFRDRNGRVFSRSGEIVRGLSAQALASWEMLSSTRFFREFSQSGRLIATERLPHDRVEQSGLQGQWAGFLKHDRIPFVSYPYEWCFGMLKDAALLQLELLRAALDEDMTTKDGSAFNVQWIGSQPVFIDIPSLEPAREGEPWHGYRQFCQTFLYPLFLQAYKNVPFQPWLRGSIEGIDVRQIAALMSLWDMFLPGVFTHVYLHGKLQQGFQEAPNDVRSDLRGAGFNRELVRRNVLGLDRLVRRLNAQTTRSAWSDYADSSSYGEESMHRKRDFVRRALRHRRWGQVWDLGANTGFFSTMAAESADYVLAIDGDWLAVERLYQEQKQSGGRNVLPLVMNLTDPSPGLGWRSVERLPLQERGRPALVLALALLHHLVIGSNVPLRDVVEWLAAFRSFLVVEFVTREDEKVLELLRHKDQRYDDYDLDAFEAYLGGSFQVIMREPIKSGKRVLYAATPR